MNLPINFKLIIKLVGLYGLISLGGVIAFAEYYLYGSNTSKIGWGLIGIGFLFWIVKYLLIPFLKKKGIL